MSVYNAQNCGLFESQTGKLGASWIDISMILPTSLWIIMNNSIVCSCSEVIFDNRGGSFMKASLKIFFFFSILNQIISTMEFGILYGL